MKYSNKIGQKTGTSKTAKKVAMKEKKTALTHECQNLNSGSLRAKGLKKNFQVEKNR